MISRKNKMSPQMESGTACPCGRPMGFTLSYGTMGRDGQWDCMSIMGHVDIPWDSLCPMGQWDGMDSGTASPSWDMWTSHGILSVPWDNGMACAQMTSIGGDFGHTQDIPVFSRDW